MPMALYIYKLIKDATMKKILLAFTIMLFASTAFAGPHGYHGSALRIQHHGHYGHHGHWRHGNSGGWVWVVPTLIGGVIGYEIAKNQTQQPVPPTTVIVQSQPVLQQNCSLWTETQHPDGSVTKTRTCN